MLFKKLWCVLRYAVSLKQYLLCDILPFAGVPVEVFEVHEIVKLKFEDLVTQLKHPLDLTISSHITLILLLSPPLALIHLLVYQKNLLSQMRVIKL